MYQLGFFRVDPSGNADYEAASTSTIEPLENVFVQGLTFRSSGTFNILIENEGDLTITDWYGTRLCVRTFDPLFPRTPLTWIPMFQLTAFSKKIRIFQPFLRAPPVLVEDCTKC